MGKYKILLFYQKKKAPYFVLKEDRIMEQIEPFVQCRAAAASRQGKYLICFLNSSLWGGCSRRRRRRNGEKSRLSRLAVVWNSVSMQIPLVMGEGTTQGTGNMESSHKSYLTGKVYGSSEYSRGDGCQVFLHNRGSFVSALPLGSSLHATAGNFLSILRRAAGLEQGSSPTFLFRLCFFNAEPCPKQDIPV